jgi:hypothetical protein
MSLSAEFSHGASQMAKPLVLNTQPPVKDKDFDGAHPEPWTSDSNIANPPTNRVSDFNNPEGKEFIPVKASISGMV